MSSELPKISIVTTSYNQGHYLEQAIRSVVEQGYPNVEYFVVDGGSTDHSADVIKKYERHIAKWVSEKDRGQANALNKGFSWATGDVLGFINSDDYLYPGALDAVAKAYAAGHEWIQGWVMTIEADGGEWPELPRPTGNVADWFVTNPVPQQACFWAGRLWREHGPFREDLRYVFDYEYWMRLRFAVGLKQPHVVHRCLGSYRLHADSKTVSQWDDFQPEFARVREEYAKYVTSKDRRRIARKQRSKIAERNRILGWQALGRDEVPAARKHAMTTLRNASGSFEAWRLMFCALRGR
jgi:glycosyltransferase involved in cell wall biosynthesis